MDDRVLVVTVTDRDGDEVQVRDRVAAFVDGMCDRFGQPIGEPVVERGPGFGASWHAHLSYRMPATPYSRDECQAAWPYGFVNVTGYPGRYLLKYDREEV